MDNKLIISLAAFGNLYLDFHPIPELNIRSSIGGNVSNYYYVNYGYRYLGDSEPQNSDNFGEGSGKNLPFSSLSDDLKKKEEEK